MWQGGPLASFRVFFTKKKKVKVKVATWGKSSQKLCFEMAIYHIT